MNKNLPKELIPKKDQVVNHLQNGDYYKALSIAKSFKRDLPKEKQSIVTRAYEMQKNESFYSQLGFNKDEQFNMAIDILKETYL